MRFHAVLPLVLFTLTPLGAEPIVDFGGDYVTADSDSARNVSDRDADLDDDGQADDSVRAITFLDKVKPLTPAPGTNEYPRAGRSAAVYGGMQLVKFNATGANGLAKLTIVDAAEQDGLRLYFQRPPAASSAVGSGVLLWLGSDFLHADQPKPLAVARLDKLSVSLAAGNRFDEARWIVGAGGKYYISGATIPSVRAKSELDPTETKWAVYSPDKSSVDFTDEAFTDALPPDAPLQAVGLFVRAQIADETRSGQITIASFGAHAKP